MRALWTVLLLVAVAAAQSPDDALLARHDIKPEAESIRRFLRIKFPDAELRTRIDELVAGLGDPAPEIRARARRELLKLDSAPLAALRRATEDASPEVRRSAYQLIERAQAELDPGLLFAVMRAIRHHKIEGLAGEVLDAIPLSSDRYFVEEARRTLVATARPADLPLLRKSLQSESAEIRAVAVSVIRFVAPDEADAVFVAALEDESPTVRFAAARELADLGDRRCLAPLVELVGSPEAGLRLRAQATLHWISGRDASPVAAGAKDRGAIAAAWRAWLENEGAAATWKTPVREELALVGRTLIALYSKNRVVELDSEGRVVWEKDGLKNPWAVHGAPNGHRFIALYSDQQIIEFDASGNQVWESGKLGGNVTSLWLTRSGRVLASMGYQNDRLLEIDRATKQVVWELQVPGRPVCASELPNGNLLVTLNGTNEVVEIQRSGRRVWSVGGLNQPYSAVRLPNGNTLVADYGGRRIVEFDSSGAKVWDFQGGGGAGNPTQWLYTVARLSDGTTMYGDNQGLKRIDRAGQVVWQYDAPNAYLYFHRY